MKKIRILSEFSLSKREGDHSRLAEAKVSQNTSDKKLIDKEKLSRILGKWTKVKCCLCNTLHSNFPRGRWKSYSCLAKILLKR